MMRLFYDEGVRCLGVDDRCYREEYQLFLDDDLDPPFMDIYDYSLEPEEAPTPYASEENPSA